MDRRDILEDSFYQQEKRKRESFKDQFRPDKRSYKGTIKDGRRTLLLDLVFILVIFGVIYPFMMKRFGPSRTVGNYSFTYSAVILEDQLHQSLEVWGNDQALSEETMEVLFQAQGEEILLQDLAPGAQEKRLFTQVQPWDESEEQKVYCNVTFQGRTLRFSRSLELP